jgi:hypothetical protein
MDDAINNALREVYANGGKGNMQALFDVSNKPLKQAINKGFGPVEWGKPNYDFLQRLQNNGAAFAARKTQHQVRDLTRALYDDDGNLKTWSKFKADAQGIVKDYNQTWLHTEYNTAVRRARIASVWHDSEEAELYVNMRWLPSRSAHRREAHVPFYNRVFKRNNPVWNAGPGTLWNCKCGVEPTDDPAEEGGTPAAVKPAPGIDNNPGESAEIFTQSHPYYKGLTKAEEKAAEKLQKEAEEAEKKALVKEYLIAMKPLYHKKTELTVENGSKIIVGFSREGNKHLASDVVYTRAVGALTKEELEHIDELLAKATYTDTALATDDKVKKGYEIFYYFKDAKKELYYNVAKRKKIIKKKEILHHFLYSVTVEIKK